MNCDKIVSETDQWCRTNPQVTMMHTFFAPKVVPPPSHPPPTPNLPMQTEEPKEDWADLFNYPSDLSDDSNEGSGTELADGEAGEEPHNKRLSAVPQLKRQKLEILYRKQRQRRNEE